MNYHTIEGIKEILPIGVYIYDVQLENKYICIYLTSGVKLKIINY
jgi:hypothetical protein